MLGADHYIRQGDHGQTMRETLLDANSDPVDIDGATVRLIVTPITGETAIIDTEADNDQDVSDPETWGMVSYVWAEGDSAEAGLYLAEFEVTYTDTSVVTFPNVGYIRIAISPQLAADPVS